ncbi:MAG: DUF3343 domain-containing protein [Tissierellia bacterium]|nr:DUF3343 domain-containing protein [Tissierellia bacterium]
MRDREFGVITFKSTHHAMRGESIFKKDNLDFKMIPTPREITYSCGLSIRFALEDISKVSDILEKHGMDIEGIFRYQRDHIGSRVTKLN